MFRALILAAFALLAIPSLALAQRHEPVVTTEAGVQPPRGVTLPLNKSQVFHVNQAITKIVVGNPDVADAVPLSDNSFYAYGKKSGSTNISVYGQDSRLLAVLDVVVGADVAAVKSALHEVLPYDRIGVRPINDTIVLSGALDSAGKVTRAIEVASQFVGKGEKVINDLRVVGSQQVMLEVKVAEMQRTAEKSLGFKPFLDVGKPGNPSGFSLSTLDPVNLSNFAVAAGTAISGNFAFTQLVDALESKGAAKVLAEPNLVAMSGQTASFLAGGEFPVPIVQSAGTSASTSSVSVEFKQFGISLAFTPTIVDRDLINLVIAPEVSQLDRSNSVALNGFVIPGISTRRAKTTIELRDGQSFAVAGLLSSTFNDTLRGIPGLMDVPVLGALAHSSDYQRNETELVIIVTPKLVQPVPADTLVSPTDSFVPPSDGDIFFYDRAESQRSGIPANNGGGLTGQYGHIIR